MEKERFEWIMSGLIQSKLSKVERGLIKRIERKFEQAESITKFEERNLERIYRAKGQ